MKARKTLHRLRKRIVARVPQYPKPVEQAKSPEVPYAADPVMSDKGFAGCNRRVAYLLREQVNSGSIAPLRDAFLAIYDTAEHPMHARLTLGQKHWYAKDFGLNDKALNCGRAAIAKGDLPVARLISTAIQMTGFEGPATMLFHAQSAAANSEWGAAKDFYTKAKKLNKKMKTNPIRWEHQERKFNDIDAMLKANGVDWTDLNPTRPTFARMQALDVWWKSLVETGRLGTPEYGPVLRAIADLKAPRLNIGPRSNAVQDTQKMSIENFRNFLSGKSICLVANSQLLLGHELGEKIDSYDLVMRFNSFVIDPRHTGQRTNIHAAVHLYHYNLDVPVDVRILVSGKRDLWETSVHEKIRPGMQTYLGDSSLSWPARRLGLIGGKGSIPTVGFNMLRTIDHLNVSPVIDLIGFDFYASGMYRVEDALKVPHSKAHNSTAEKDWILSHAQKVSEAVISMR